HGTSCGAYGRQSVWRRTRPASPLRSLHRSTANLASPPSRRRQLVFRRQRATAPFTARLGTLVVPGTGGEPVTDPLLGFIDRICCRSVAGDRSCFFAISF